MEKKKLLFLTGVGFFAAFILWTVLVCFIDVGAIGPEGSSVGFSTLNGFIHELTSVNWLLYTITDWLGLVPIAVAFGFAFLGLFQVIRRKSICKVDRDILALGLFYLFVIAVYLLFELLVINYRPILIDGHLEASYPSSTTMLVMCVMPMTAMQLNTRIKSTVLKRLAILTIIAFIAFMVIGRLLSGVHWITDIIGGALFSIGLVLAYTRFME